MAIRQKRGWIDWTKQDPKIIQMFEAGKSINDIAKAVGIARNTASNRITELCNTGQIVRKKNKKARVWSKEQIDTIIAEYESDTCDTRELARRLGMNTTEVHGVAKHRSLKRSAIAMAAQKLKTMIECRETKKRSAKPVRKSNQKAMPEMIPSRPVSQYGVFTRLLLSGGIEYSDVVTSTRTRVGDPTDRELGRCRRWQDWQAKQQAQG